MSRSGYTDDYCFDNSIHLYRGRVASAMRGRRGQAFLKELLTQMDAMPEKRLVEGELECNGQVCTLGVVTRARKIDTTDLKFEDQDEDWVIGKLEDHLNIADSMIREIMFMNDEGGAYNETPEHRWFRMRCWVVNHIKADA